MILFWHPKRSSDFLGPHDAFYVQNFDLLKESF